MEGYYVLTRKRDGVQYYRRKSVKDPNKKLKTLVVHLWAIFSTWLYYRFVKSREFALRSNRPRFREFLGLLSVFFCLLLTSVLRYGALDLPNRQFVALVKLRFQLLRLCIPISLSQLVNLLFWYIKWNIKYWLLKLEIANIK